MGPYKVYGKRRQTWKVLREICFRTNQIKSLDSSKNARFTQFFFSRPFLCAAAPMFGIHISELAHVYFSISPTRQILYRRQYSHALDTHGHECRLLTIGLHDTYVHDVGVSGPGGLAVWLA